MLTPTYVHLRYWFYPIGNTPAVNVFRDIPLCHSKAKDDEDQQHIKVLLLACGDPRNILFSLSCEQEADPKYFFDFTCCDLEPAVLARNVFLLTLIAKVFSPPAAGKQPDQLSGTLWNLFYHFFVPEADLEVLRNHVADLVDCSTSAESWNRSSYGASISMLSDDTRQQLRGYWTLYGEAAGRSTAQAELRDRHARTIITTMCDERFGTEGQAMHGFRSAGAHWLDAVTTMSKAFKQYWKTGVVGGNHPDIAGLGNGGKGRLNPLFAISSAPSGDFAVHYGSDPLLGFHLAEAFNKAGTEQEMTNRVVRLAKSQFRDWCRSFRDHVFKKRVHIRIFQGEAVRFCHELQARLFPSHTGRPEWFRVFVGPWTGRPLQVDQIDTAPTYDMIDTSNLVDHVGILNLLPAVAPLLTRKPSATLYTEGLLLAAEDPVQSLRTILCADVATMALVIGLAPLGLLTGITTDAVGVEAAAFSCFHRTGRQQQHRLRVPWKVPALGDMQACKDSSVSSQLHCDAEQLAAFFFDVYLKMFAYEDLRALMTDWGLTSAHRQLTKPLAVDLRYYTRLSLAVLLQTATRNLTTNWTDCLDRLLDKILSDRQLMVGSNSYQELLVYLELLGIRQEPVLAISPREMAITPYGPLRPAAGEHGLLAQEQVPSLVYVALVVPRKKLKVFTNENPDRIGTPGLHLSVRQTEPPALLENSFFAIHTFFGKLEAQTMATCTVVEDPQGWRGSADLIVMCAVPAHMLLIGPRTGLRVGLKVNSSLSTSVFIQKLGIEMLVYESGLDDPRRLWILKQPPGTHLGWEPSSIKLKAEEDPNDTVTRVRLLFGKPAQATAFEVHEEYPDMSEESKCLKEGAQVVISPWSPCSVRLRIGELNPRRLSFPFPIDGSQTKTKIARKSSWIEVEARIAKALERGGYNDNPFAVAVQGSGYTAWSIPRVKLHQQPSIDVPGTFSWLPIYLRFTMTENERAMREQNERVAKDQTPDGSAARSLLDLKESLNIIFQSFVGLNPQCGLAKNFQFSLNGSTDTILLASALKHDRDGGSILLDAYVVQLTKARCAQVLPALQRFVNAGPLSVRVTAEESGLWKKLFPALAERCRYTWSHKKTCEYLVRGQIPVSTKHSELALCSCGEGEALEGFPAAHRPFAKFATRIALSPVFSAPYIVSLVDEQMTKIMETAGETRGVASTDKAGSSSGDTRGPSERCDHCRTANTNLKLCARCGKARYCSRACQKMAWQVHKGVCGR